MSNEPTVKSTVLMGCSRDAVASSSKRRRRRVGDERGPGSRPQHLRGRLTIEREEHHLLASADRGHRHFLRHERHVAEHVPLTQPSSTLPSATTSADPSTMTKSEGEGSPPWRMITEPAAARSSFALPRPPTEGWVRRARRTGRASAGTHERRITPMLGACPRGTEVPRPEPAPPRIDGAHPGASARGGTRPGTSRRARRLHSSRPSCSILMVGRRMNAPARSRRSPRFACSRRHHVGDDPRERRHHDDRGPWVGPEHPSRNRRHRPGRRPTAQRRDIGGLGAVQDVAAANTPTRLVRPSGSTAAPRVPGSSWMPASTASS